MAKRITHWLRFHHLSPKESSVYNIMCIISTLWRVFIISTDDKISRNNDKSITTSVWIVRRSLIAFVGWKWFRGWKSINTDLVGVIDRGHSRRWCVQTGVTLHGQPFHGTSCIQNDLHQRQMFTQIGKAPLEVLMMEDSRNRSAQ